jgi:hypothetical protein
MLKAAQEDFKRAFIIASLSVLAYLLVFWVLLELTYQKPNYSITAIGEIQANPHLNRKLLDMLFILFI